MILQIAMHVILYETIIQFEVYSMFAISDLMIQWLITLDGDSLTLL